MSISYLLLADGSSDRVLMYVLNWLLRQHLTGVAIRGEFADFRRLPHPPTSIADKIIQGLDIYGACDILFIHRDAENQTIDTRINEIHSEIATLRDKVAIPDHVFVIPVRMQEAWFLFNVDAIRAAAGNPHGSETLTMIPLNRVESIPNPKQILHDNLRVASGLHGRRLQSFNTRKSVARVAEFIEDFRLLRSLSAFQLLERDLIAAIRH
jgi:hypothetical protein